MLTRLQRALAHEQQFVADASHELRTPLALLTTELELRCAGQTRRPAERRPALRARRNPPAQRTGRPTAHPGPRRPPRIPPLRQSGADHSLLHESVARFAATGADITTRAEPDLFVSIDPDHLRRILTAVLDNAITHGDGEIAVTAHARDGAVDIGVRDHGPGFADHFLPVAFDRFTRADTARGGRGSGLGLAIVAALTTTHGGHANATNHPDGGAELRITLPTPRPPFHEELPRITSSDTKDPNREHDTSDQ